MTNILFTLILALGIKIADANFSPKYYLITYQNGQQEEIMLTKKDNICPSYCDIDHAHQVNMCENNCEYINKDFTITKGPSINNNLNLYCQGKQIMYMKEIKKDSNKKKNKANSIKIF
tara:strand:- start:2007 stop:2360 length:354 start_codon:yes stop_codon:yes gene_type:complete